VKLLFDANISRRIVPRLIDLFPESTHVTLAGFSGETPDRTIWEFARENGFAIVTADADFVRFSETDGMLRPR
jgi:predicted nuclease of predicted toxin-antitoxin system